LFSSSDGDEVLEISLFCFKTLTWVSKESEFEKKKVSVGHTRGPATDATALVTVTFFFYRDAATFVRSKKIFTREDMYQIGNEEVYLNGQKYPSRSESLD